MDEQRYINAIAEKDNRILAAVAIAGRWASTDGAHHKLWVIDQMIRALLTPAQYADFLEVYEEENNEPWDGGIAP